MTAKRYHEDSLRDIIEACEKCLFFIENMDFNQFTNDDKTVFAVIRGLEIVGEAVKQIPKEIRENNSDIPWRAMAGMRDKLIHQYFGISHKIVWRTVSEDIPELLPLFRQLIK